MLAVAGPAHAIVGGTADSGDPAVVALIGPLGTEQCTATLIAPHTLLTAGHCGGGFDHAAFGSNAYSPSRTVKITGSLRNPGYIGEGTNGNPDDDELLFLASDVTDIAPVPVADSLLPASALSTPIRHVGFGDTTAVGSGGTGRGPKETVAYPITKVTAGVITSGYPNGGAQTCNGDSGGPALYRIGNREQIVAVVSNGPDCTHPGGDSRVDVSSVRAWIAVNAPLDDAMQPARRRARVDVDGDGRADFCGRDAQGVVCFRSNGTAAPVELRGPAWSDASGWSAPSHAGTVQFGDVNGDGKADVCGRAAAGFVCALSDGTGFPTELEGPAWSDAAGWNKAPYSDTIHLADVNGDGKDDVCARDDAGIVCAISNGAGFPTQVRGPAWKDSAGWNARLLYATIQFPDINGDGKDDVCARYTDGVRCSLSTGYGFAPEVLGPALADAKGWNHPQYATTIRFADLNGDGKADLCARDATHFFCHLAGDAGFGAEIAGPAWSDAAGWWKPQHYQTIVYPDLNGDGKSDVCARGPKGITCVLSESGGAGAFGPEISGPDWSDANGWDAIPYYATIGVADVNGDGDDDLCARGPTGIECALSTGTALGTVVNGPAWSDAAGWNWDVRYRNIQFIGAPRPAAPGGPAGGSSVDAGGAWADADGSSTPSDAQIAAGASAGCACRATSARESTPRALTVLALGAIAVAARRRRSRARGTNRNAALSSLAAATVVLAACSGVDGAATVASDDPDGGAAADAAPSADASRVDGASDGDGAPQG